MIKCKLLAIEASDDLIVELIVQVTGREKEPEIINNVKIRGNWLRLWQPD